MVSPPHCHPTATPLMKLATPLKFQATPLATPSTPSTPSTPHFLALYHTG